MEVIGIETIQKMTKGLTIEKKKKKYKRTSNDLQSIHINLKIE
jgi:hypothetical protein